MTVVVLGGGGAVGSAATAALVERGHDVVVADLDGERAREVARRHRARLVAIDLTDDRSLRALLAGARLVLATAGPFHRFGPSVLRTAIDTGTAYVDVADDPVPTLQMLELDGAARAAGVAAVVGAGASPGLSNLLAVLAAERMDEVDRVVTMWPVDPVSELAGAPARPTAATVHWIHQLSRAVPALRDGRLVDVDPLTEVPVPLAGVGTVTGYLVGHPEAVTLHRGLPTVRESTNAMLMRPGDAGVLRQLAGEVRAGLDEEAAATRLRARFAGPAAERGPAPPVEQLLAAVAGRRAGRRATAWAALLAHPPGGMAAITALPAVAAAESVLRSPQPGVLPPEIALDPRAVFDDLAVHVPGAGGTDDLVAVRSGQLPESDGAGSDGAGSSGGGS